jgi:hypothetical protein
MYFNQFTIFCWVHFALFFSKAKQRRDMDPTLFNADLEPAFNSNMLPDPDPTPHQSEAICNSTDPKGSILSLQASIVSLKSS